MRDIGGEAHLADACQAGHRVGALQPQHEHGLPLHAGELERLHVLVDAAHQRAADHLHAAADDAVDVVFGWRYRVGVVADATGSGGHGRSFPFPCNSCQGKYCMVTDM
jgi:hypothetical protein